MAKILLNGFPDISSLNDADELVIWQDGAVKNITVANLRALLGADHDEAMAAITPGATVTVRAVTDRNNALTLTLTNESTTIDIEKPAAGRYIELAFELYFSATWTTGSMTWGANVDATRYTPSDTADKVDKVNAVWSKTRDKYILLPIDLAG